LIPLTIAKTKRAADAHHNKATERQVALQVALQVTALHHSNNTVAHLSSSTELLLSNSMGLLLSNNTDKDLLSRADIHRSRVVILLKVAREVMVHLLHLGTR
jgi:hypothetical protein